MSTFFRGPFAKTPVTNPKGKGLTVDEAHDIAVTSSAALLKSKNPETRERLVIYSNPDLIRAIQNWVATHRHINQGTSHLVEQLIKNRKLLSGDMSSDSLIGVDEFSLSPALKWNTGFEAGAEAQITWYLGDAAKVDKTLSLLLTAVARVTLVDLLDRTKTQNTDTPLARLVYPEMPVLVSGGIAHAEHVLSDRLMLQFASASVEVLIALGIHVAQISHVLPGRPIDVLGVIDTVQPSLTIRAAAVLICAKP